MLLRKVGARTSGPKALFITVALGCGGYIVPSIAQDEPPTEKVLGIGGFFFKSSDPKGLASWYRDNLGVSLAPQGMGDMPWSQEAGFTVFDPFPADTPMIPADKEWMINFRVGNLERMVEQLRRNGNSVDEIVEYPHGKFTTLQDPEGNPIQLWEPPSGL